MTAPVIRQFVGSIPDKGQAQTTFDTNVDAWLDWTTLQFAPDLVAFGTFAQNTAAALVAANLPPLTGQAGNSVIVNFDETAAAFAPISGRNLILNALGRVNLDAYTSGSATGTANEFTIDQWFVVTSGQNLTFTGTAAGRAMTAPAGGVSQVIEGVHIVGGTYVLNWPGTATATVNGTARTKGETFTLTANTNATVRFSGGTFSTATDGPQLELGSVPTAFEIVDLPTDQINCGRYYRSGIASDRSEGTSGQAYGDRTDLFPPMRAAPTITYSATTFIRCNNITASSAGVSSFTTLVDCTTTSVFDYSATYKANARQTS